MKSALFCAIFFASISNSLFAQNTFPVSGNVGIGTSNPSSQLQVNGLSIMGNANGSNYNENLRLPVSNNDYASIVLGSIPGTYGSGVGQWTLIRYPAAQNNMFSIRHFNTDYFNILTNGHIGFGTQNPVSALDVEGSTPTEYIRIQSNASGSAGYLDVYSSAPNGFNAGTVGFNTNGAPLVFNIAGVEKSRLLTNGNWGIGTTSPDEKLTVYGTVHARAVKVDLNGPLADFVFGKRYKLHSLDNVNRYIQTHHHLSEMPSAAEASVSGLNLGDINQKLLLKVEELTLYLIKEHHRNQKQELRIASLEAQLKNLEKSFNHKN